MLSSDAPKTTQINVRLNPAEKEMIERIRNNIRPRVSASKLLIYLCEEKAREMGIIHETGKGYWTLDD